MDLRWTAAPVAALTLLCVAADARAAEPMVGHTVFFKLKESNSSNKEKLVAACQKYLADHPGVVFFAAGVRGEQFDRDVNATDWDVALHLVFKDQASHDAFQEAKLHKQFIAENEELWGGVRVYDSLIESGDGETKD